MRLSHPRLVAAVAIGSLALAPLALAPAAFAAPMSDPTTLTVVSPATRQAAQWTAQAYDCDQGNDLTPQQTFALSSGAPLGQGAHFLKMGSSGNQTELYRTTTLDGTPLSGLSALAYSTTQHGTDPAVAKQPAYLRLTISSTGTDVQDSTLYFEPALNPDQGGVAQDTWQSWNAGSDATWTTTGGTDGAVTLSDYISAHPLAKIVNNDNGNLTGGGLAVLAGCAGANQTNAVLGFDRIVATTAGQTHLWDFEPDAGTATGNTVVIKDANGVWNESAFNYSGNAGNGALIGLKQGYVIGPKVAPLGKGSRQLIVKDNSDATQFWRTTALDGKPVDNVRGLGYSSYAEHAPGLAGADLQQPAYLRLSLDSNGPDTQGAVAKDTTLNFEPADNSDQGSVQNGVWQHWNAFAGQFRVVEGPGETADSLISLPAYMARHPKAVFASNPKSFGGSGAVSLVVGSAGDNQRNGQFAVDNVSLGLSAVNGGQPIVATTTYDFEPTYTVPTAKTVTRVGTGPITLSGTAAPTNTVEIRLFDGHGFGTLAGTANTDSYGKWTFPITVRQNVLYRAYLANTYGTTDIASATAHAYVQFGATLALTTKRGVTSAASALNPAIRNVVVRFDKHTSRGWIAMGHASTDARGVARFSWKSAKGTVYQVRAYVAATSTVLGNVSVTRSIRSA
jgi:hypothetical protein